MNEVIAIDGKSLAPMSTEGIRQLFAKDTNLIENGDNNGHTPEVQRTGGSFRQGLPEEVIEFLEGSVPLSAA